MAGKTNIEHKGIVDHCQGDSVFVKILAETACASCKMHKICGMDTQEKTIEIDKVPDKFHKGDKVIVSISEKHGYKALFFSYLLPFIISLLTLIISIEITENEGLSGLFALVILVPYFLCLKFFNNRLKKSFRFNLNKIHE
ncbi:MAG: SoxR reducing system RseC family protein [Bacteroidota bacterium]